MPMIETISSPYRSRERIMVYGREGTGKSSALLSIARRLPESTFYVIDNDNSYDRLLETDYQDVDAVGNMKFGGIDFGGSVNTWEGGVACIKDAFSVMGRDDWLSVDMLSKYWDAVQEWFIEQVFQEDIDDYFLKVRLEKELLKRKKTEDGKGGREKKSLGALEGWMDWPVINQTYHKRVSNMLLNCPGHLFVVCESTKLQEDDDKGVRELYGPYGVRPAGQKRGGHLMQTVLFMSKNSRTGEFKLSTVKDRGRVTWNDEVFGDFAGDYLVGTAGWETKRQFVREG